MVKHIFLSFVEEDLTLVKLFRGQAKNKNSSLVFDDYSVHTPYNSTDAAYIRRQITERIRACSTTICLIGTTTHTSDWVDWEVAKSYELSNGILGVRLHNSLRRDRPPVGLTRVRAKIVNWDIDAIMREL